LYRSLETKVEERNQQLRAATDVAQVVTSTIDRKDMLKQTVELLCERFYIDFAGIYLLDSSKTFFSEKETAGRLRDRDRREGMGMRIRTQSIFGKAIASKQPQLALAPSDEGDEHPDNLLPDTLSGIVIPITMGDEILGLLEAQSLKRDTFPPETVSVLKMLANQLGNGLQNVRLIENAQVDLHETALLYQASRRVSQSRNPDEITQVLQDTISRTDYMGVLLDENEGVYSIRAIIDPLAQALERNLPKVTIPGQRLWDQLAGLPYVLIDNLSQPNDLFALTTLLAIRGCHSAALLPIYGGGKVISILALGTRKDTPPAASDLEPYLNMIEVAANTLEHLRIVSTLENNLSELQTLSIISQTISEETELGQQTAALREQIIEMFNGKVDFAVALYDPAQDKIAFPRTATNEPDLAPSPVVPDEKLISAVIKSRKSILSGSQEWIDQTDAARRSAPTGSWLGIPLLISGHPIGAMAVWDPETEDRFSEENLQFFNDLAAVVAINIRNTQLLNQTQATLKVYHQEHFLLNNLLENIPGVVTFKDRAGQYLRVSRIAAQARGYQEPSQMEGKTEVDLLPTETGRATHQVELDLMAKDESQRDVIEHLPGHIDGERWWLSSRLPIKDEEEDIVGLLSISQDITTLKETEQLAQKRASQLRTTSEIARDASSTLNVEELLSKSVNLIRDRFGYYHASIFLNDPLDEYTILRESTGEAGRQMKMAGHRLAIGLQSVVGSCADQGKPLVVNDVSKDPNYYANPMLPGTRSELAIPLKTGERVIGVIDVQSSEVNAFQPDDIQILQILADQIAVALVNADMYVETQENVTKHRFLHQITSAASGATRLEEALSISVQGLRTAMACDRVAIYLPNQKGDLEVQATAGYEEANAEQLRVALGEGLPGQVALDRQPILIRDLNTEPRFQQNSADMRSALAVPILYSDRSAGVLVVESARTAAYDENDQEILASLGGNLGAILANAQLVAQVRQQVEQQKKLFEITSKIRRSGDIKTILETSARELAKALHARRATIEVLPQEQPTSTDTSFSDPWNPGRENER
ncbi:MAG TPA: GAF domain-containing protein, partial [Anaerolineaceae bacterium]|nr:GAF domain-containing protein [Anaerolineaceae bacterium]